MCECIRGYLRIKVNILGGFFFYGRRNWCLGQNFHLACVVLNECLPAPCVLLCMLIVSPFPVAFGAFLYRPVIGSKRMPKFNIFWSCSHWIGMARWRAYCYVRIGRQEICFYVSILDLMKLEIYKCILIYLLIFMYFQNPNSTNFLLNFVRGLLVNLNGLLDKSFWFPTMASSFFS